MGYVYPNNLMAKRSETKKAIKGAMLLALFLTVILGLFLASDTGKTRTAEYYMHCTEIGGEMTCSIKS